MAINTNIEIGQRWVCIKNWIMNDSNGKFEVKVDFKRFDVIDIIKIGSFVYAIKNEDEESKVVLMKKELLNNFITQAEWRDEQINLILDDE